MKLFLALVLVPLSVLATAKPKWVNKYKHHHHRHYSHKFHHHGHQTCRERTTDLYSKPTTYPGTPNTQPGTSNTYPTTLPGTPTNIGTPTSSVVQTSSTTHVNVVPSTQSNGWEQIPKGNASFTAYNNCQAACKSCSHFHGYALGAHAKHYLPPAACGQRVDGYSAAVNELAFGANDAAGGACGRCFRISSNYDPYTPSYAGPFGNTIVVKVNDLCPVGTNNMWCGQRVSEPLNSYGAPMQCVVFTFLFFYEGTRDVLKKRW